MSGLYISVKHAFLFVQIYHRKRDYRELRSMAGQCRGRKVDAMDAKGMKVGVGAGRAISAASRAVHQRSQIRLSALALLLLWTLGGCTHSPMAPTRVDASIMATPTGRSLDASLARFLTDASAGSVTVLPSSPWGANAEVQADAPYFAASRRICRHLTIRRANAERMVAVACRGEQGNWTSDRLVTALFNGAETW